MSGSECASCGAALMPQWRLCHTCTEQLEYHLAEIPGILADLGAVATRTSTYGESVGGTAKTAPLPIDTDAMDKGRHLMLILTMWALNIQDDTGAPIPARTPAELTTYLMQHIGHIRSQDWAPAMADEVREHRAICIRASDRAAQRVFAGLCPTVIDDIECASPVYTKQGAPMARCRTCGTTWDVTEWRARALEYALLQSGTAAEISRMLSDPVTGEALAQGTIRQWVRRGKLSHLNEVEIRLARIFGQNIPAKVYQIRKVRSLWARMQASQYGNPTLKNSSVTGRVAA